MTTLTNHAAKEIEMFPAEQMSVRIIGARPAYLGYSIQYEYARKGRIGLYGNVQTQIWRTVCWDGYAGKEGPKTYKTISAARAAAKRIIRYNNRRV